MSSRDGRRKRKAQAARRGKPSPGVEQVPPFLDKDGYLCVVLVDNNGDRVVKRVHELVALAHVPNPDNLPAVRHKNGDLTDNRAENLEWYNPASLLPPSPDS